MDCKKMKNNYINNRFRILKKISILFKSAHLHISTSAHFIIFLFAFLLIASCAQIVAPSGGSRDNSPPKVVKYSPDSAQLNFNSKIVELTFNEYIVLKDLNSQLIISPPLDKTPDIKTKNKTLTIDLSKATLKPNTTYSINFGNSLQDINENNPNENFKYIFSTGSYIDSLMVKGKVQTAFDHKSEKGILVMLYEDQNDSVIYKKEPDYFAKTKEDGSFQIFNIKPGKYKIAALKDANANYKYDVETENIAFANGSIDPSEKQNILLDLFQEAPKKIILKKYFTNSYGKITLVFNQGSDSLRVLNLSNDRKGVQEFSELSKQKDTLIYWIKNYEKDSLKLQVSNGNKIIDTVEFKMIKLEDALKSKKNPFKLRLVNNWSGNQNYDLNSKMKLVFNNPINNIKTDSIINFKEDTILYKDHLAYSYTPGSSIIKIISLTMSKPEEIPGNPGTYMSAPITNFLLKENTKYHLFIPPGTFTDYFGLTNDTIKIDFKTREAKYYGSLKLKVNIPEIKNAQSLIYQEKDQGVRKEQIQAKYIVQLLDEKETVVREDAITKSEIINYEYLHPQNYKLKIVVDSNGNGKWDSGDYLKKIQPEKVIYNTEAITIRSNWDADIDWKVSATNN
jgi:uncharacterized protein (DUF2141 family)